MKNIDEAGLCENGLHLDFLEEITTQPYDTIQFTNNGGGNNMNRLGLEATMAGAAELAAAMLPTSEGNLTWKELAKILGVQPNAAGDLDGVALVNACMNVQSNPTVLALSESERLRVIRSASAALSKLL